MSDFINISQNNPEVQKYDLPDSKILESASPYEYCIWRPDSVYIVLGRSNDLHTSVYTREVINDNIKVVKRMSGGESVLISPNMAVFSLKIKLQKLENPNKIFQTINQSLISSLKLIGINDLHSKGISDISIGNKKIMGSSMYLNNKEFFYHAVLNINEDIGLISKYLKHPKKEPTYREKRNHEDFVTSLRKEGYNIDFHVAKNAIETAIKEIQIKLIHP